VAHSTVTSKAKRQSGRNSSGDEHPAGDDWNMLSKGLHNNSGCPGRIPAERRSGEQEREGMNFDQIREAAAKHRNPGKPTMTRAGSWTPI